MPTKKVRKRVTKSNGTVELLVQMMNDMNAKLHHIHKDVDKNSKEVAYLKEQMAVGKGGVKVLLWITGMATTLIAVWNWFVNGK